MLLSFSRAKTFHLPSHEEQRSFLRRATSHRPHSTRRRPNANKTSKKQKLILENNESSDCISSGNAEVLSSGVLGKRSLEVAADLHTKPHQEAFSSRRERRRRGRVVAAAASSAKLNSGPFEEAAASAAANAAPSSSCQVNKLSKCTFKQSLNDLYPCPLFRDQAACCVRMILPEPCGR
jgi:hypothetical protein